MALRALRQYSRLTSKIATGGGPAKQHAMRARKNLTHARTLPRGSDERKRVASHIKAVRGIAAMKGIK